jgi:hypothetical protein
MIKHKYILLFWHLVCYGIIGHLYVAYKQEIKIFINSLYMSIVYTQLTHHILAYLRPTYLV